MQTEQFVQFLVLKGLQDITIFGYVGGVRRFTEAVGTTPTIEQANGYMTVMYTSEYSYSYKTNTALAIEKYMEFLGSPVRFGRRKKPRTIIKHTLTEAEVTKFIFNCKNIREKAIISLLAYSGIRNKELCDLKVRDVDLGRNVIRVIQGKGLKDGISNISPDCTRILLEYLTLHPRLPDEYLFTTIVRKNRYNERDLRKLVRVVGKRAEIERRVYPHLFRHSLSVNMLLRGADVVTLKKQLRHSLLETTLTYLNSIVFGERNLYEKFAPSYL